MNLSKLLGIDESCCKSELVELAKMAGADPQHVDAVFEKLGGGDKISLAKMQEVFGSGDISPAAFRAKFNELAGVSEAHDLVGPAGINGRYDREEFGRLGDLMGADADLVARAFDFLKEHDGQIGLDTLWKNGFAQQMTPAEFIEALEKLVSDIVDIVAAAGINRRVDQDELSALLERAGVVIDDETFEALFDLLADGSDQISINDLVQALGGKEKMTAEELKAAFEKLIDESFAIRFDSGTTGIDNLLDLQEFSALAAKAGVQIDADVVEEIFDHIRGDAEKISKDAFTSAFGGTRLSKAEFGDALTELAEQFGKVDIGEFIGAGGKMGMDELKKLLKALGESASIDASASANVRNAFSIDERADRGELGAIFGTSGEISKKEARERIADLFAGNA